MWIFDWSVSAALCVPTALPAWVNCPFVSMVLTLCFNEERRWWGGGAFTFMAPRRAHHCSILLHKAIRGPRSPQIMGDAFPMMTQYVDAYWLQPAQSMLHVFNDVTAQSPVGILNEMFCSELRWEDRQGKIQHRGSRFDNVICLPEQNSFHENVFFFYLYTFFF